MRYSEPVARTWLLVVVALLAGCRAPEDPVRTALRARLKQEARLSPDEIRRLFDEIAPVIAGKNVAVRQGALTRTLDDRERATVLGMLSDPADVYDVGTRTEGQRLGRGLRTGATPTMSELDASQTLWVDVDSFTPRRFEFEYSSPGFGDYSDDLSFIP